YSPEHIGRAFSIKSRGGIGIEGMQEERGNGIEAKIKALARRDLDRDSFNREAAALVRMAEVVKAIGSVYSHQKVGPRWTITQKEWNSRNKEMMEGKETLTRAARAGDPRMAQSAARKTNKSCGECHSRYCPCTRGQD